MPQGYLVTLGDGNLDDADFITASQSTFTTASTIGTGSWIWSGVWDGDGNTYNNITDTGTYYEASDGNVYFVPDNWFTTSGTAEAENPPAYSSTTSDGIVSGTSGNDTIDENYNSDPDGDTLSTGADSISAGAGDDTVIAGEGDDTVDGGTGADSIEGGQGADSIEGGSGADTIYGDTDGVIEGETTTFEWDTQGVADETSVAGGITGNTASGDIQVAMTITQEENFTGASMETNDVLYDFDGRSDTSSIELYGGGSGTGQNAATMTMDFTSNDPANITDEVMNVSFGIFDLDESVGQFLDQVVITAFDANGNPVSVVLTPGDASTITVNNATGTATAIGGSGGSGSVNSLTGYLNVSIAGPVAQIVIDYNNVDTAYGNHAIRVGDLEMTPIQIADPAANADSISGGDDNDLIYGGEGNDDVSGDAGDDSIHGETGSDTIFGWDNARSRRNSFIAGDELRLNVEGIESFDDLLGVASQTGGGVLFDFGNGDEIFLAGTRLASLDSDQFTFY